MEAWVRIACGARSSVAEHPAHNRRRAGSNPAGPTISLSSQPRCRYSASGQRVPRFAVPSSASHLSPPVSRLAASRFRLPASIFHRPSSSESRSRCRYSHDSYGAGGGVEMPFGGYGKSGFGREKGLEALRSYTQVKNVCVYVGGE